MNNDFKNHEPTYRIRRGKRVRVPDEWVGKTTSRQTIRKRASKQPPGQRKEPAQTRKAAREREDVRAIKEGNGPEGGRE